MKLNRIYKILILTAAAATFSACGTSINENQYSTTRGSIDPATLPVSLHGNAIPLTKNNGVIITINVAANGSYDRNSVDMFTNALRTRSIALHTAGKKPFFTAIAVDISKVTAAEAATQMLAEQDTKAVEQTVQDLSMDKATVEKDLLLFFNDSAQKFRKAFGQADADISVAIVDAKGEIAGSRPYQLPAEQNAALSVLDTLTQ